MSLSTMSRRERTACAVLGMAVLYGLAVLLFFTGREAAWAKARKAYAREAKTSASARSSASGPPGSGAPRR